MDVGRPVELGRVGVARAHVAGLQRLELLLRAELVGLGRVSGGRVNRVEEEGGEVPFFGRGRVGVVCVGFRYLFVSKQGFGKKGTKGFTECELGLGAG